MMIDWEKYLAKKAAVWETGHEIADTVAEVVKTSLPCRSYQTYYNVPEWGNAPLYGHRFSFLDKGIAHIAYGILRGAANVFAQCDQEDVPWFEIDKGYFRTGHYDGYYRVSLRGTQQTTGLDQLPRDYDRLDALKLDVKPWRGFDESKPALVCPPTEAVAQFFNLHGLEMKFHDSTMKFHIRYKGDPSPINFDDYSHVITFNSSVGWQALQHGIPCISDPTHSILGAFFKDQHFSTDDLSKAQYERRRELFAVMAGLQLTLDEMREGKLWPLMERLMSISATMDVKPSLPLLPPTASTGEPVWMLKPIM